jgi:glycosyltransferase involved in cell wall biosynthesis
MKIVVTVPYTPWPVTRGTGRLIVNLLRGLSRRHEVTLVTMTLSAEELGRVSELEDRGVRVRPMLAPHRRGLTGRILRKIRYTALESITGMPREISYSAPREFLELVADTASEESADLVLASYWQMYRLPDLVKDSELALVTHDLDYIVNRERLRLAGAGRRRERRNACLIERWEIEAYKRFDTILAVTEADAEALRSEPFGEGKRILTLPLALDLSVFRPGAFERERGRILLLGSFHSDFNRDALSYFITEVFPAVRRDFPGAVLEVVGTGADEKLIKRGGPGIEYLGVVEDIVPRLGGCSLMVLPLRFGGGVRIRMMEAAAMGTPVVSTPAGAAGMGMCAGREYIEAAGADEIAAAVVSLLGDPDSAAHLGRAAREWAEANISMEDYSDRLDRILRSILIAE